MQDVKEFKQLFSEAVDANLLTEEKVKELAELFNTAVEVETAKKKDSIRLELEEAATKELTGFKEKLVEKLDAYLSMVAEEWLAANKLAIVSNTKLNINENLVKGFMEVLKKNNVNVPEADAGAVAKLEEKLKEVTGKLNTMTEKFITEQKKSEKVVLRTAFEESVKGLSANQIEQVKTLIGDMDFTSVEQIHKKVGFIKENVLKVGKVITEIAQHENAPPAAPPAAPAQRPAVGKILSEQEQQKAQKERAASVDRMASYL